MERLPDAYSAYQAASIRDFLENESMISEDARNYFNKSHPLRKAIFWFGYHSEIMGVKAAGGKIQVPIGAHVYLPKVSHLPIRDRKNKGNSLTLFDQTGEIEVEAMTEILRRNNCDPEYLKGYSWFTKDVKLFLVKPINPKFNRRYLVDVVDELTPSAITRAEITHQSSVAQFAPKMIN